MGEAADHDPGARRHRIDRAARVSRYRSAYAAAFAAGYQKPPSGSFQTSNVVTGWLQSGCDRQNAPARAVPGGKRRGKAGEVRPASAAASAAAWGRPSPTWPRSQGSAARSVRGRRARPRSRRRTSSRSDGRPPLGGVRLDLLPQHVAAGERRAGRARTPPAARSPGPACRAGVEQRVDGGSERRRRRRGDRRTSRAPDVRDPPAPPEPPQPESASAAASAPHTTSRRTGLRSDPGAPPTARGAGGAHARRCARACAWPRSSRGT